MSTYTNVKVAYKFYDCLVAGLTEFGFKMEESKGKYTKFSNPSRPGVFYYVGLHGALRMGRTVVESRSIGDATRQNVEYQRILVTGELSIYMKKG
jgi:hypothetical protein